MNQATEWTPENIRKDPSGYLTWAIAEVGKTEGKLKDAQLALETQRNDNQKKLDKTSDKKSACAALIKELADKFDVAQTKNEWPVTARGVTFDKPRDLKDKVVEVNRDLESANSLIESYTKALGSIDRQLGDINKKLTDVENLKTTLDTKLEEAKVQQTVEGIDGIHTDFDHIVSTSDALSKTAEHNTSVDEMLKPTGNAQNDEEFDKIMAKRKGTGASK